MEKQGESCGLAEELRENFKSGKTLSVEWRREQLDSILRLLRERRSEVSKALHMDLGKSSFQSFATEMIMVENSCKNAKKNLKKWMAPTKASTNVASFPSSACIVPEPFGVVLVIAPWNFPFLLSIDPMIGAISARNSVVLKPSEMAPATSATLAKLISLYLDSSAIRVMVGGPQVCAAVLQHRWDKIFFTGGPRVGRSVMSAAAILKCHNFYYCFIILKEFKWYIILLILGNDFRIWKICRSLAYIHGAVGVCHRDIKPQNLLVNPHTHQLKLCDFGSAKMLVKGEPNISYICSWYYRALELIFGATEYTTVIEIWSLGCALDELLLSYHLFPGESGIDQLVEIIKVWRTLTREEIKCMNSTYTEFKFPQINTHPWHKEFHKRVPPEVVDLVSRMLQYLPNLRCTALETCVHPFFYELWDLNTCLPNGHPLPPLFNFKYQELKGASPKLIQRLIPEHARK